MSVKHAMTPRIGLLVGLLFVTTPATAQTVIRSVGVADRARPDYDPIGQDVGSFLLYPSITATVDGTDNYRATDTNRLGDAYLTLAPELRVVSNWSRNRLTSRFFLDQSIHARLPDENATQYGANADGELDISRRTAVTADVSAAHYVESRASLGSFQNSPEPVKYEAYHAAIGVAQEFNRLTINASVGLNDVNFHDVKGFDGSLIDQTFRNNHSAIESTSAKYDIGNGIGIIVSGSANQSYYSFHPGAPGFNILNDLDRQSSGYTVEGGLTFELSSLIIGSVQVGWLNRNYRDTRLQDFSGLSFDGNILWNVTPLTSLRFRAARSIQDTSSTIVAGNTVSDFSIGVDHELYRYIILSGNVNYESFTPNGPGIGGRQYGGGAGLQYLIDRHWSATMTARYDRRDSDSSFLRYHATTFGLSVKYAY